jgi:Carboxypeptidase regulatory-like domain
MTALGPRLVATTFTALFAAAAAVAGTVHGTVIDRTTGKPASNVEVTLLNTMANMAEVGTTKSDAQGQFTFDNPAIGGGPMLLRATMSGVAFNTSLPPGRPDVTVDVYEISKDPKSITVDSHVVIFEPSADKLIGAEEYIVKNNSQPPAAFFRTEGNFQFAIPENAKLQQVATTSSTGMPVVQAPIEKGKGLNAIAYAFRPGETSVRLSYEMPYSGSATVKLPAGYDNMRMLVVVPPGVTITGEGLQASGQEQGMMVYTHAPLAAKSALTVNLSGVGAPQAVDGGGGQGGPPQEGNSRTSAGDIHAIPGRLDDFKWYLLGGLAALFAMGAILLSRKQVVVTVGSEAEPVVAAAVANPAKAPKPSPAARLAASSPTTNALATTTVAAVNREVTTSLDSLKDSIFRLELRRQAGTISEEDYARERAEMEKLLRDLVRG